MVIVICKIYFPNILNVSQFKLQTCVTLDLGQQGHGLRGSKLNIESSDRCIVYSYYIKYMVYIIEKYMVYSIVQCLIYSIKYNIIQGV